MKHGRGAPPLVFAHGFGCALQDWDAQLAALRASHEVVACDLRGHGATPGRAHECSIEHYGGDVAALVSHLGFPQCILVGHSMGCRVVLEAARIDPERVAGLVLVDGSRLGAGDPEAAEASARAALEAAGYAAFAEALFREMFFAPSPQADAIVARALSLAPEVGAALFPRMARWDAAYMDGALAALRVPLLVIQSTTMGAERRRVPLEAGGSSPWLELVKAKAPHARVEVITGASHFPHLDASARVNRLLASFAAR